LGPMLILVVMDFSRMMINRFRKPKSVEVKKHPVKTKKSKPADEESHND
jgi:hypothetical protein